MLDDFGIRHVYRTEFGYRYSVYDNSVAWFLYFEALERLIPIDILVAHHIRMFLCSEVDAYAFASLVIPCIRGVGTLG